MEGVIIAISLGFYQEMLNVLERFGGDIFYIFAGVEIMTIFSRSLYSNVLPNSFWRPWRPWGFLRGSLGSLLFLFDLRNLFSSVWQVSKSLRFSAGVYTPQCSKLNCGDHGIFRASFGVVSLQPLWWHETKHRRESIMNSTPNSRFRRG